MAEVQGERALGLRERKKRRTRATLIDAAVRLCDRQGFDETTVDQIAAVADVSPRTFSRYFATKDAIAIALIDEVLANAATELARQPLDIGHFEALRRAYLAMLQGTRVAADGGLSSARLLQILRITVSSATLRHSAIEYRANAVDEVMARRLGTSVDDRRVKLLASVWGAIVITAVRDLVEDAALAAEAGLDDVVEAFQATFTEFADEIASLGQPV